MVRAAARRAAILGADRRLDARCIAAARLFGMEAATTVDLVWTTGTSTPPQPTYAILHRSNPL